MKKEFEHGKFLVEIDIERKLLIIEDTFNIVFQSRVLLDISKTLLLFSEEELFSRVSRILSLRYDEKILMNLLKLSVEEGKGESEILGIGVLKPEDYSLYYTETIMQELGMSSKDYCFIGGQILRFYNVNRQTSDADILLLATNDKMEQLLRTLKEMKIEIEHFNIDPEGSQDPIGSLIRFIYRGVSIDILATKYEFQKKAVENSVSIELSNKDIISIGTVFGFASNFKTFL